MLVFLIIYSVAFALTASFSLRSWDNEIKADGDFFREYAVYKQAIAGQLNLRSDQNRLLESCFFSTILPALIQRMTKIDPGLLFKIFPSAFSALMPAFVYLTVRQYLDVQYSLIAAILVISNFYFLYDSNIGRVGIALGFASGMVWVLLAGNAWLSILFAIAMILSHYGTTYLMLYVIGLTWLVLLVIGQDTLRFAVALVTIGAGVFLWHFVIVKRTGKIIVRAFLGMVFNPKSDTLKRPISCAVIPGITRVEEADNWVQGFFRLEHREAGVQVAFGKTWRFMNIAQKIEWVLSWLIVLFLTAGLGIAAQQGGFTIEFVVLGIIFYSAILLAIAIPHLSVFYGALRVYFSSLIVLAPCFVFGVKIISESVGLNGYLVAWFIIFWYALAVSGWLHRMMGIKKRH